MAYKRKYRQGEEFKSVGEVFAWLGKGEHLYWRGRFTHCAWAQNWQVRFVINAFNTKVLRKAIKNELKDAPHLGLNYDLEK